ncbi:MAG: DUF4476 domain-containing protein [Bacteroidales bacterium]|jgi:hypothetical protein|nr:DUF4476 domain-containing protein [Bacteroidales bacterium]
MKKIVVFIVFTAVTTFAFSQTDCTRPLPTQQFKLKHQQIKGRTTDASKLQLAVQIVQTYCFSSEQVKEIALLFEEDKYRLQFAQSAYENTIDKDNFYEVYDAFIYYSAVFRLHDYLSNKTSGTTFSDDHLGESINTEFPDYHYPDFRNYQGTKNCSPYISQRQFNYIVNQIRTTKDQDLKLDKAIRLIQNNCIPTDYLMKIGSLFSQEDDRYAFAKAGLSSVYDIDQYPEMRQIFSTPRNRSNFASFLAGQASFTSSSSSSSSLSSSSSRGEVSSEKCFVSQSEMNSILNTLRNESFNSTRLNAAKHIIESKNCLSPEQIKDIVDLFDYENSRLEIAIVGYDFTKNKNDYYTIVSGGLGFDSSKKKLLNYINSNP